MLLFFQPQKYEEFDVFEGESRSSVDSETNSAVHFFGEEWRLTVAGCLLNFIAKVQLVTDIYGHDKLMTID